MKFCQPDLQSRQQLQALRYKIEEIRDCLYECADLDRALRSQPSFYNCMVNLLDAGTAVGDLRKFSSPLFLCDLERDLKKVVGE